MTNLTNTAKKIDIFFRILQVALSIAAVACLIGLAIIAAKFLFNLAPEQVGTGYTSLEVGFLELTLTEAYAPHPDKVLIQVAISILMTFGCTLLGKRCVIYIRQILKPMTQGEPFQSTVSENFRKLAILSILIGIAINISKLISQSMLIGNFRIVDLMLSERISHVTINYTFDLSFLIIAALLFLFSYLFRYGEELQQLSDETL